MTNNDKSILKFYGIASMIINAIIILLVFCSTACADSHNIASIIYSEDSNPKSANALLQTYYKSKRKNENLEQSLKRQSCAFRFKSKQYQKAFNKNLNAFEKKIYNQILEEVKNFQPQKNWEYIKHESQHFYKNKIHMIQTLKTKWGNDVDYTQAKFISGQWYFPRSKAKK